MKFKFSLIVFTLLFSLLSNTVKAETNQAGIKDSLIRKIENSKGVEKIKLLIFASGSKENFTRGEMIRFGEEAFNLAQEIGVVDEQFSAAINLEVMYRLIGDNEKSLIYVNKAIAIAEKKNDKKFLAGAYMQAYFVNVSLKFIDKGIVYLYKALSIFEELKDYKNIIITYNHLFFAYSEIKDEIKTKESVEKGLYYAKQYTDTLLLGKIYNNFGVWYDARGDYETAKLYYQTGMLLKFKANAAPHEMINSYRNVGVMHLKLNQIDSASIYIPKIMPLLSRIKQTNIIFEVYQFLSDYYFKTGKYELALDYQKKTIVLKDSLYNAELKNKSNEIVTKLDLQEKENESNKNKSTAMFLLIILFIIIIAGLSVLTFFMRKNRSILQANLELNRLSDVLKAKLGIIEFLSDSASKFISSPIENMEEDILTTLNSVCTLLNINRAFILRSDGINGNLRLGYQFAAKGWEDTLSEINTLSKADLTATFKDLDVSKYSTKVISQKPAFDEPDFEKYVFNSKLSNLVVVPLKNKHNEFGYLVFIAENKGNDWETDELDIFYLTATMLSNAFERKKTFLDLQESESKFKVISEIASDCAYLFEYNQMNKHVAIRWATNSFRLVFGYEYYEVTRDILVDKICFYEDSAILTKFSEDLLKDGYAKCEIRMVTKMGEIKWITLKSRLLKNKDNIGETIGFSVANDITERKLTETKVSDYRKFIEKITATAPDLIFVYSLLTKQLTYINDKTVSLLGYEIKENSRLSVNELINIIAPEDLQKVTGFVRSILLHDKDELVELECCVINIHNERIWINARVLVFSRDSSGRPTELISIIQNIQSRKMIERALSESERSFRLFFENLPLGAVVVEFPSRKAVINNGLAEILGYEKGIIENWLSEGWLENITAVEDIDRERRLLSELFDNKTNIYRIIKKFINQQSKLVWAEVAGIMVRSDNGAPKYLYLIVQDITAKKRAENEVRRSEEKYKSLVDNIPLSSWISDKNGQIILISNNIESITGFKPIEFYEDPHKVWYDRIFIEDKAKRTQNFTSQFETRIPYEVEYKYKRKDGEDIFLTEKSYRVFVDDKTFVAYGILSDTTNNRVVKRVKEDSELRFRTLAENIPEVAIQGIKEDGTILFWNNASEKFYGLSSKQVVQHNLSEIRIYDKDMNPAFVVEDLLLMLSNDAIPTPQKREIINIQGESLILYTSYVPINNISGDKELYCFDINLTQRYTSEAKLHQALMEKEVLLKEVYHRVKNNLQIISSLLSLQSRNVSEPEAQRYFLESQQRVNTISLIHQSLYQSSDLRNIRFINYIKDLISQLKVSYSSIAPKVNFVLEIDDISLNLDTSIPVGLIVNEIVSNSLKYAFINLPDNNLKPTIGIVFKKLENQSIEAVIYDNGKGMNVNASPQTRPDSLGFKLIFALIDQIGAEYSTDFENGCSYKLKFFEIRK